ncbi:MAG: hypothetical protein Q7O66_16895 [Dehalococcoidia bacterium]|nr:hypothetical protein [Dehalococcoidia bacterium]
MTNAFAQIAVFVTLFVVLFRVWKHGIEQDERQAELEAMATQLETLAAVLAEREQQMGRYAKLVELRPAPEMGDGKVTVCAYQEHDHLLYSACWWEN